MTLRSLSRSAPLMGLLVLAAVAVALPPSAGYSQAVPLPSGAGRRPAPPPPSAVEAPSPAAGSEASPASVGTGPRTPSARGNEVHPRRTLTVNPSRPTYSDNAGFVVPDWIELEVGYGAAFDSCPTLAVDPVLGATSVQDGRCTLQSLEMLAKWSPRDLQEYRVGWDVLGVQTVPGRNATRGAGDPYIQAKFGIPLDIEDPEMHRLAILGEVRPGIGQAPLSGDGFALSAWAVYSTFPRAYQVHAQAGMRVTGLLDDFGLQLPLSGVFGYSPIDDLVVFGEFLEILQLNSLQESQTRLLAGLAWSPISSVALDLSGGVGLTRTVPAGIFQLGLTFLAAPIR
jgi:hypothetical protein